MALPRRRSLTLALVGLLALAQGGCASPTLPLPPPEPPEITGFSDGQVTLTGTALPDAIVYLLNQNQEVGVIVRANGGFYQVTLKANLKDVIAVWQEQGIERSPSVLVTVLPPK